MTNPAFQNEEAPVVGTTGASRLFRTLCRRNSRVVRSLIRIARNHCAVRSVRLITRKRDPPWRTSPLRVTSRSVTSETIFWNTHDPGVVSHAASNSTKVLLAGRMKSVSERSKWTAGATWRFTGNFEMRSVSTVLNSFRRDSPHQKNPKRCHATAHQSYTLNCASTLGSST